MTLAEKLRLIADAIEGKCKIEFTFGRDWYALEFDNGNKFRFNELWHDVRDLLCYEVRIAKSLPMLSDEDTDFAEKYLPHDWWIVRSTSGALRVSSIKPRSNKVGVWFFDAEFEALKAPTFPKFECIKREDDDCYTIQELLDNYKKEKESK